jgi:creatinine amidohydrolase
MTAFEVDALDRERTCFFVSISPVEQHGPHLPLGTDIFEAEGLARRVVARLAAERQDWRFVFHPPIPLGSGCFPYPGTISVEPGVVAALAEDIALSLAAAGFRWFVVSSHHGGPSHNLALDRATRRVHARTRGRAALLALAGRTIVELYFEGGLAALHDQMGDDDEARRALAVDVHAGAFETSAMLALEPDLVRPFAHLEPVLVPLEKLTPATGRTAGKGLGYLGAPAIATRERGEAYLDFIVSRSLPHVRDFLDGKGTQGLSLKWRLGLRALEAYANVRDVVRRAWPLA